MEKKRFLCTFLLLTLTQIGKISPQRRLTHNCLANVEGYHILYPQEEIVDYVADPDPTVLAINDLDPTITVNQTQSGYGFWAYRSSSAWPNNAYHSMFLISNNPG